MEKLGYTSESCVDGSEAIPYLSTHSDSVKAVLLDIYMPEVDGISVLGHFRSNYPELPVIIITGSDDAEDEKVAHSLGATGFIKKPFPA